MNTKTTLSTVILSLAAVTSVAHSEILSNWDALGPLDFYAQQANASTQHDATRADVQADLDAWRASGLAEAHAGKNAPNVFSADYRAKLNAYQQLIGVELAQASEHAPTRAEVTADLEAWRESGLAQAYAGKNVPDVFSADYRAKLANYQQLSKQYQQLAEQG